MSEHNPPTSRLTSKRPSTALKLFMIVGSPLLFLAVLEMVLRLCTTGSVYFSESNPHYQGEHGWTWLRPNTRAWWYGCHYEINGQGYRMPHEVGAKHGPRILAIGDSVTLGMGVCKTQDVWPNKLERLLHEKGWKDLEVINSAVQGWNLLNFKGEKIEPSEFTAFVKERAPELQPELVVYCISVNDVPSPVVDTFTRDNEQNKARFRLFPEQSREWFKRKAIYRLLRDGYREMRFRKLDFSVIPLQPTDPTYWDKVRDELGRLKSAVEANGAKLQTVLVPFSYQLLPANRSLLEVNRGWKESLEANGIPCIDLTGFFTADTVLQYYALGDYCHLNSRGHQLVAEEVARLIEPKLTQLRSPGK
ncbi:MAG TPA: SGNH/GDSL hydrolase family protein [Chthoniobacteraceae bacterium]|nr:SGNH/GDSL hydrolase family protein [Chthoniobacteraceae bacterium]